MPQVEIRGPALGLVLELLVVYDYVKSVARSKKLTDNVQFCLQAASRQQHSVKACTSPIQPVKEGRKSGTFSSLITRQFPHEFVENNIEL